MSCSFFLYGQTNPLGRRAGGEGSGISSLVSGSLQNTLGRFWLSSILGGKKIFSWVFCFVLNKTFP